MANTRDPFRPRWAKVLADLRGNKTRAMLVVASIAVGVFAVGTIVNASMILSEDFGASYASVNPANITIITEPFDQSFVDSVTNMEGVKNAEGRRHLSVNVMRGGGVRESLNLVAIKDPAESAINVLEPKDGAAAPDENEIVIGFDPMSPSGIGNGDQLAIELSNGNVRAMPVVGLVVDQTAGTTPGGAPTGYVTHSTLEWLGAPTDYDRLVVTVADDTNNEAHVEAIAAEIENKVEHSGREVLRSLTNSSNEHPQSMMVTAVLGVFAIVGVLIMLLSSSLIFNTLNALLAQDLRQIGVMKLVGAKSGQILGMYIVLILVFGLIALCLAIPAGALAGYGLSWFMAYLMKAHLQGFRVFPTTIVIQIVLSVIVPLAAGYVPVHRGSKAKVERAISNAHTGQAASVGGLWRRLSGVRWLSRPIVLSLRNTFRRKGRLILTLFTLVIAGAIFIAVFNIRVSMQDYMDVVEQHFGADVTLDLARPYRISTVAQAALELDGVIAIEAWSGSSAELMGDDGRVLENLRISAPPSDSELINPHLSAGRWLVPGDSNAIVVSDAIQQAIPGIQPGDTIQLSVAGGREQTWVLIGMFSFPNFSGDLLAYAPFETVSELQHTHSQATNYRLVISDSSVKGQKQVAASLDSHLRARGFAVHSVGTGASLQATSVQMISIFVSVLLIMAVLTAIVGSIGLTGTMGMNVLERTREIGIARTIGAVNSEIVKSVVIESAVIGIISWAIALPTSYPISLALLSITSMSMEISEIALVITPQGIFVWLGVVLVLAFLASILPARNASRLTIREVLAYE